MNKSKPQEASIHEDGVDFISNLPDHVLLLILSGLPSTKESIQTSILSRRWRYLWTSIPSLDFDYRGGRKRSRKSKFKNIVDSAVLHRSVDVNTFRLSCSKYFSTSRLERWMHAIVMRNVKQLDLSFWRNEESESEDMVMPHCLVTCASLEVLRLNGHLLVGFPVSRRLILPSFSSFPALRVLMLEKVELFDDELVEKFLQSCPLLEDLTLDACRINKLDLLCISCPNLKKLSFIYWSNSDLCGCLKLSCPNLVFLEILGDVASNYIFQDLYSLKEAVIDRDSDVISMHFHTTIARLFHKISHVESLRADLCFLDEYMDNARDLGLPNLKTLELTTINYGHMVEGLNKILKICPKLESLCLAVENFHRYEEEKEIFNEMEYPNLDGVGTWNLTPDVAWVEFFEFNGEKSKLTVKWSDKNKSDWESVVAKWGNEANFSHFIQSYGELYVAPT